MLDRVVKPQVGFGCSVLSPNKKQDKKLSGSSNLYKTHKKDKARHPRKNGQTLTEKEIDFSKPRDLYNRQNLLKNSLNRVNNLPNPDREDILAHVQYLQDNRRANLTIIRNISVLIILREKLGMPFRNATSTDMRAAFTKIEYEGWKTRRKNDGKQGKLREYGDWTEKKFKLVIKKFYKVVFGNDEDYPEAVKWIKTKFTKDKSIKKLDMSKFLTSEQITKLIDITEGLQRKTLLAICYELGCRPGELLSLTNLNLHEERGELFITINESKTNERVIKIVEYKPLLKQWLAVHPLKHQRIFPLWISEATNYKNKPLGLPGAEKIAEEMIAKVDPTKKAKLYTLRHSRATFC